MDRTAKICGIREICGSAYQSPLHALNDRVGYSSCTLKMKPRLTLLTPRSEQWTLTLIVILFVLAGLVYSVTSPFMEVSDEVRHYAFIEHLAQGNGLPIQDPAHRGFYEQEGSQPPLYYTLMALLVQPFDRSDFRQLAQFNPHARLGRADTTNNWNQLIHTDAEQFPWRGTVLVMHLLRLLGVAMGAATVVCAYLLAKELIGRPDDQMTRRQGDKVTRSEGETDTSAHPLTLSPLHLVTRSSALWVPLLAAAFVAFNPMFVFISASVNNDTLATLLSSIGLVLGARIITRGMTPVRALILGIVLGCAALTKSSALALAIVIPVAVAASAWLRWRDDTVTRRQGDKVNGSVGPSLSPSLLRTLSPLLLILLPVALIAGWWYARNQVLYGDLTGTTMMALIAGPRDQLPALAELIGEWGGFRQAYWGLFGAVNIPMANWIYIALDGVLILAVVGLVLVAWDRVRARLHPHPGPLPKREREKDVVALMCLGVLAVAVAALARWTSITLASQGRLLFPVITIIATFLALGLSRFAISDFGLPIARSAPAPRHTQYVLRFTPYVSRFALLALPVALAALTLLAPFVYIQPAYALPARLRDEAQLPPDMVKTEMRFGDSANEAAIRWIGYRVEDTRIEPGGELAVTLYWQGLKPIAANDSAFIKLYGRDGALAAMLDTYPGGGMWQTTRWVPGEIIADRYRLRVSDTLSVPTVLRMDAGFWNFDTKVFLPAFDGAGQAIGRQRYEVAGANQITEPRTQKPDGPYLSHAAPISLTAQQEAGKLQVTTRWLATQDFGEEFTIFMHLVDANGEQVGQADGPAMNGDFPIRWWRQGDLIDDQRAIDLPDGLPPGQYRLEYGFYRPTDGMRLPAFDATDQPLPDAMLVTEISIP